MTAAGSLPISDFSRLIENSDLSFKNGCQRDFVNDAENGVKPGHHLKQCVQNAF